MDRQILETKTIQVRNDPEVIDSVNKRNGIFFWSVQGDTVFQHIEHTNYATITYVRDKTMPRYDEIVSIETQLESKEALKAEANSIPKNSGVLFFIIGIVVATFGLGMMMDFKKIGTAIISLIIAAGLIYLGIRKKKSSQREFNDLTMRWTSHPTIDELLQQANELNGEIIQEIRNSKHS